VSAYAEWLLGKLPTKIQLVRGDNGWTASTLDGQAIHGLGDTMETALYNLAIKLCLVN